MTQVTFHQQAKWQEWQVMVSTEHLNDTMQRKMATVAISVCTPKQLLGREASAKDKHILRRLL